MRRVRGASEGGFTLLEAVVTFVLIAVIVSLGVSYFTKTVTSANTSLDTLRLSRVQVAARQLAATDGGVYPTTVTSSLEVAGETVTTGPSTGPAVVSVERYDETTLVLADLGADGTTCSILVDHLNGVDAWGEAQHTPVGACSAGTAAAELADITSTDVHDPSTVTLT